MENIIEPDETFDFSKLSLAHPSGIQGGAYFTKIEHNKNPLYIQTTKSLTRQGFVKTGKKYYSDLMFDKNAESLINWFENLEEKCQKLIFEKRESWFQNSLEESDIETAFNSTIRVYKSGKFYLVRVNVKNNHLNEPAIKIYDEKHNALTMNDITSETNIISILEVQGIKFTSRNFQIEIELKQVMVLDNEKIFDNFLIKSSKNQNSVELEPTFHKDFLIGKSLEKDTVISEPSMSLSESSLEVEDKSSLEVEDKSFLEVEEKSSLEVEYTPSIELDLDMISLEEDDVNELKEVDMDLTLENDLESLKLKRPNQVYFELYKEARNKAKLAKKNAIIAYLEAKNIKKTYMIENINDSDSDFDAEIDEVSESELEGFE